MEKNDGPIRQKQSNIFFFNTMEMQAWYCRAHHFVGSPIDNTEYRIVLFCFFKKRYRSGANAKEKRTKQRQKRKKNWRTQKVSCRLNITALCTMKKKKVV